MIAYVAVFKVGSGDSFEIDVVAVGKDDIALFEVKWERLSGREARKELEWLKEKAEAVETKRRIHLYLIARKITGRKPENAYDLRDLTSS